MMLPDNFCDKCTMKGYRFVTGDMRSKNGVVQWELGKWQKFDGKLKLCESGLHASKEPVDSLSYVFGERWFRCEARGTILMDSDKFCASEMRLTREISVNVIKRFAVECAKHMLHLYEEKHPADKRPRLAIEAAELYLAEPTEENLNKLTAAWAAGEAAWAAGAAAGAARAAARAAAWDAAWAAERRWQNKLLKKLIKEAEQKK